MNEVDQLHAVGELPLPTSHRANTAIVTTFEGYRVIEAIKPCVIIFLKLKTNYPLVSVQEDPRSWLPN